ncbi:MAG: hypothetical protein ABR881_18445 [Candidatus Sulfotelmatobacter sp.]|jgi:hypothetical protein
MKRFTPKFLLALSAPLVLTACATIGPPQPPSLELPKPPSDLRAMRKGDHVTLTWTAPSVTTDRQTIRSVGATRICRGLARELTQCGIPVGEAAEQLNPTTTRSSKQKVTRSSIDSLPEQLQSDNPSAFMTYAIEVLNAAGRGAGLSNQVRVSLARTFPPPHDFAARVTSQGVVLTWTNDLAAAGSTLTVHYIYRVYRRPEGSSQQILAGEIPAGSERSLSLTDSSIEWEKTYEYRAETVTVIAEENKVEVQIEGDDTPEIKVFAHDVFPPTVPSGLQAVFSGPGQKTFVDLVWAPVSDIDLDGYNIYRHEDGMTAVKLNAEPLKTPAYRDANVMLGKRYFYSVSAVDIRGNESGRSEETSETVP